MNGILKEIKDTFKNGSALTRFIYINLAIFIVFRIIFVIIFLSSNVPVDKLSFVSWMGVSPYLPTLFMRPWTLITYMFYHEEIWHIVFNLLTLFWFGKIFLMYFDNRKFIMVYLLGGLTGGLLFLLFYNIFPVYQDSLLAGNDRALHGASASAVALIIALCFYAPNFKVYMVFLGEVKLLYVGIGTILLNIIMIYSTNSGGVVSHLGGALFGYIWVKQFQRGNDFADGFGKALEKIGSLFKRRKLTVTHSKPPSNDYDYNRVKVVNQKEIDRILDKISKAGYESLSKDEKDTLFRLGNK